LYRFRRLNEILESEGLWHITKEEMKDQLTAGTKEARDNHMEEARTEETKGEEA
jgi:hypothetical protein